jgi:nucleoside-diphosphate-sugar epimerase
MLRANPLGAELVIGHAVRLGLDPVVHCSSVTALLRPGAKLLTADLPPGNLMRGYARSKVECENYVRELQGKGAPVAITYPGSVTGPAAGSILGEATQGIAATLGVGLIPTRDAALTIIDARDVGAIHAALMTPGLGPRRIMCGGHFVTPDAMARYLGQLTGHRIRVLNVPAALLRGAGLVSDVVTRALPGLSSPFTHEAMVYFTCQPPTDDSAVQRELGIRYREIKETLRESILAAYAAGLVTEAQLGNLARRRGASTPAGGTARRRRRR